MTAVLASVADSCVLFISSEILCVPLRNGGNVIPNLMTLCPSSQGNCADCRPNPNPNLPGEIISSPAISHEIHASMKSFSEVET